MVYNPTQSLREDRFDPGANEMTMKAIVTLGNGGFDMLKVQDVLIPELEPGEVLLQVLAAGMNNTEINTRLGWYSSSVVAGTEEVSDTDSQTAQEKSDGGWNESTPFPFIQGTDCCGRVVALGPETGGLELGTRVLVRSCIRTKGWDALDNIWMASDFDGAFAQFVKIGVEEVFPVNCDWSDAELGTIPCAYGTSESMLHRAGVGPGDRVLIAGASGGVGSASIQLAKRRGAEVIAVTSRDKLDRVRAIGADQLLLRTDDIVEKLGEKSIDVVVDNVGGEGFPSRIKVLRWGGRFVSSGAIAGPLVNLDMRDFYLKDLNLIGCTAWDEPVFPNLISYIEKGEIKPLLEKTFPLESIVEAQKEFLTKKHVGKFVLLPPPLNSEQLEKYPHAGKG